MSNKQGFYTRRRMLRSEEWNDAGMYDRRVTIMILEDADNQVGGHSEERWIPYKRVWANIRELGGENEFTRNQSMVELETRVVIRYRKDITREMAIKLPDGRMKRIDYIMDLDHAGICLVIHCIEDC